MPLHRPTAILAAAMLGCGLLGPTAAVAGGQPAAMSLPFAAGEVALDGEARRMLDGLAALMKADRALRIRLAAHSSAIERPPDEARRASLRRARAAWEYLTGRGVERDRITVWAHADQPPSGAPDRIDVIVENK